MKKVTSKYFSESEFERCTPPCSLQKMKQSTMDMFDEARRLAGIPLVINSAYRSVDYEKSKGRAGTSSHTLGKAIDIRCNSIETRYKIVVALLNAGFTRIGIANNFIHADNSEKHQQDVIWLY